jgi:hypothetical protein
MNQHLPLQGPPKFTPTCDFWSENLPSGNPDFLNIRGKFLLNASFSEANFFQCKSGIFFLGSRSGKQ